MKYSNTFTLALILCFSADYIAISVLNVKYLVKLLRNKRGSQNNKAFIAKGQERILFLLIILLIAFLGLILTLGAIQSTESVNINMKTIVFYGLFAIISPGSVVPWLAIYLVWVNKKYRENGTENK